LAEESAAIQAQAEEIARRDDLIDRLRFQVAQRAMACGENERQIGEAVDQIKKAVIKKNPHHPSNFHI
jgi:uncharacterized protein (DUF3084 family)